MEQPELREPETIASRRPSEPSRPAAPGRRRAVVALYVLLAVVVVVAGVRTLLRDAENRAEAARVVLEAHAFVPFGGGPGGWSGYLEIRNTGQRPVSVLDVDLPRPIVLLDLSGLPLRVDVRSSGRVSMRLRLDCAAGGSADRLAIPSTVVRVRNADGSEHRQRVTFRDLVDLVAQLEGEQCGGPDGGALSLGMTYQGSRILDDGGIETTVLLHNELAGTVRILDVTGASGWPASVKTGSTTVLAAVGAGETVPLTLQWDLSACPRITADEVISSMRFVMITPEEDLRSGTVDLGERFARDFFEHYQDSCR
jgi:hypothetical protein